MKKKSQNPENGICEHRRTTKATFKKNGEEAPHHMPNPLTKLHRDGKGYSNGYGKGDGNDNSLNLIVDWVLGTSQSTQTGTFRGQETSTVRSFRTT